MKMNKSKRSIKQAIFIPVSILAAVACISAGLGLMGIISVMDSANKISDEYMASVQILGKIEAEVETMHKYSLSHITSLNLTSKFEVTKKIKEVSRELEENIGAYEVFVTKENKTLYEELEKRYSDFEKGVIHLIALSVSGHTSQAYEFANSDLDAVAIELKDIATQLTSLNHEATEIVKRELDQVYKSALVVNFVILAMITVISALVFVAVRRLVIKPVVNMEREFSNAIENIMNRKGDLTVRLAVERESELGSLVKGINIFFEKLQSIIGTIKVDADKVEDVANEVFESIRTSNAGAADLSALTEELSATMQNISENLSTMSQNSVEVTRDVKAISKESMELNDYSKEMKENAVSMKASAEENVQAIHQKVNDILDVLNKAIADSKSVDEVNSLTDDILSISSQTNLLALNASIEAARAGEAGKGFAVVADEIRMLADSSRETANHIQEVNEVVIHAVQNLVEHAKALTGYMTDSILPEFHTIVNVGEQYKKDAEYIEASTTAFKKNTEELMIVMGELETTIGTIDGSVKESTNGIYSVAENVQELVGDLDKISSRMEFNQEIAQELKEEVGAFEKV